MKKRIALTIVAVTVVSYSIYYHHHNSKPKQLPPGYSLVCDSNGIYAFKIPEGIVCSYEDMISYDTNKVIKWAWGYYDAVTMSRKISSPSIVQSDWKECK